MIMKRLMLMVMIIFITIRLYKTKAEFFQQKIIDGDGDVFSNPLGPSHAVMAETTPHSSGKQSVNKKD